MENTQAQVAGFDIDGLDASDNEPITFEVAVIKDDEGNAISGFLIVGKNSEEAVAVNRFIRMENIKRAAKRRKSVDTSTDEGAAIVAKTVDNNDRLTALAITVGWFGFNKGGVPITFDKALVEKMFDKYPRWQELVLNAFEEDANFTKALLKA